LSKASPAAVVPGLAQEPVIARAEDFDEHGMPAADDERDAGVDLAAEERREEMAFEVIDGEEGLPQGHREALGRGKAYHEGGGEPGSRGRGETGDLLYSQVGRVEDPLDEGS